MRTWARSHLVQGSQRFVMSLMAAALPLIFLVLSTSQQSNDFPAFARKYGLRGSACHESWPMLNYFGQKFKDNGYQLMNDRDAPIWQNNGYWPVTFRFTPFWSRESVNRVATDQSPTGQQKITTSASSFARLDMLI